MGDTVAALEAIEVSCAFERVTVLDRVSLAVPNGQCLALVGESGAGKTTLLRCFNRMVIPASGHVRVEGVNVARQPAVEVRRSLGYVPQDGGLLPHWNVLRNVALVPRLLRQTDIGPAVRRALEQVGLAPETFGRRYPHELSGGQRQRVALARAIAARPRILLMDEPFGALDAISRSELQTLTATLRRELDVTTLLVTHDLVEASLLGDEIAVMRSGRVEQRGTLEALRKAPATPYVASLLARALPRGARA